MNTCTIFNGAFPIWGNAMASIAAAKNLDWTGNAATLCARTLDRDTRLAASIDDRVRQTGQLAWSGGSS